MAAVGLGAATSGGAVRTARAATSRRLIDVHSHIIPPFYLEENRDRIAGSRGGEISRTWLGWTVSGYRPAIAALTGLIPTKQILFGSDFPYRPLGETADSMPQLGLSEADLNAIGRDNALALLPRLKTG